MQNFALWATDSTAFTPAVTTIYDNSYTFSPSTGRVSVVENVDYTVKVSYRPQTGFYRVVLSRVADGFVVADSGNQWDSAGISSVCLLGILPCSM